MKSAVSTGDRCKWMLALCALLASCGGGEGDGRNPFLRPYIRADAGNEQPDMRQELDLVDPFAQGRISCEREAESCTLPGATGECVAGTCRLVACLEGSGDCDDDPNNGCEVDLTRPESCGSCVSVCGAEQICQKGASGYTCAVGVLCAQGSFDLDDRADNGCEWSARIARATAPQPEARFAVIQRVALAPDTEDNESWTGAITGFDAQGNRAVSMGSQQGELTTFDELDEPFSGVARALDVSFEGDELRALDVWQDVAYLHELDGSTSTVGTRAVSLSCSPRTSESQLFTQPWRGGALARRWAATAFSSHTFAPLDACERDEGDVMLPALCPDTTRAFGSADYLRWFYPYESEDTLENRGAHAPSSQRLGAEELAACTQCALDVTTGSFVSSKGCYDVTHCELGQDPLACAETCAEPATGCPDFEIADVVKSPFSERHYVVTRRGVVVLRDDGQVWLPLARIEEPFSASVVSGASFLRVAVARSGDRERLFLLHNQGFVRVIDVSLNDPVTVTPAHPDIPIFLGDLDERGAIAFLASDANTLLFSDPYEGRLIRLNGLDHKRERIAFEQDVPGNGFFGASHTDDVIAVYRVQFGILDTLLLTR